MKDSQKSFKKQFCDHYGLRITRSSTTIRSIQIKTERATRCKNGSIIKRVKDLVLGKFCLQGPKGTFPHRLMMRNELVWRIGNAKKCVDTETGIYLASLLTEACISFRGCNNTLPGNIGSAVFSPDYYPVLQGTYS